MRALLALGLILALAFPLAGCGAFVAGAAGGLAANAVIEHERNRPPLYPPPPLPSYYYGR
jgi:hypothetical protein